MAWFHYRSAKQYSRIDLSPRFLRISTIGYEPIEFELISFDPLGKHNIPGVVIFCNVSEPFDFALIRPFRSAAFDLNQNDLEKVATLERCLGLR